MQINGYLYLLFTKALLMRKKATSNNNIKFERPLQLLMSHAKK
jgi:hypothetical protein